jgi:beta-ribofuranosylaminobenzene 5'-phosphate synthase
LISRHTIPEGWVFSLFLPYGGRSVSGNSEVSFFERHTPTPPGERLPAFESLVQEIMPAVFQGDLHRLRAGLINYQTAGLKRREVAAQSPPVSSFLRELDEIRECAYGMSSLGPLIFAISFAENESIRLHLERLSLSRNVELIGHFAGRNTGYESRIGA